MPDEHITSSVGYRFFALPAYKLAETDAAASDELLEPELPFEPDTIERALGRAEFREYRARDRLRQLLFSEEPPPVETGEGARAAFFARPPQDLPALLRLADQLDSLAGAEAGERALVWRCECGTRYAVPVGLVREVSIKCERCSRPVELRPTHSLGEEWLLDPAQGAVNTCRKALAEFFRESMARGWPVLVSATST